MKHTMYLLGALAGVACLVGIAAGDEFVDTFEHYPLGPNREPVEICGLPGPPGGWEEWEGSVDVCGDVVHHEAETGVPAFSGKKSFRIIGREGGSTGLGDDTLHTFEIEGGRWVLSVQTFAPDDMTGEGFIVMLDQYPYPLYWCLQVHFNGDTNQVVSDFGGESLPLIRERWAEFRAVIDLEKKLFDCFYDGVQFVFGQSWCGMIGLPQIRCLDFYAGEPRGGPPNGTTGLYFDDASLTSAGLTGCTYRVKKNVKGKGGCNACPKQHEIVASGEACEKLKDCKRKFKRKRFPCPDGGPGICKKLKGNREKCIL